MSQIPPVSELPDKLNVEQVKAIILETIINPIYTNDGERGDRATSISKYKIEKNSIVGQFIATNDNQDALFDFEAKKTGSEWDLTYGYADEQIKTADFADIRDRLKTALNSKTLHDPNNDELRLINENAPPFEDYVVLRNITIATNLFLANGDRQSAADIDTLFKSSVGSKVALRGNQGHIIEGVIFDSAFAKSAAPSDPKMRSHNNDFVINKEGFVSLKASIVCDRDILQDDDYNFVSLIDAL